ncbi:MAG: hypothetical protein HN390_15160 [Anaerolineae bacterium]|jgi:hypothetical protein|nr:hypothetical protein [Anaerolineae bacterium]MBT7188822.1 hypothetical protein [Anaerolineae bacterium]MBT7989863.1 hypothetical protein [Anaerolineae bacterium]
MNYDFSQLNDKEFERLAADLLSKVYDARIERFKSGKDGGVDGRYFSSENNETIIQCKHYLKTGYQGLISTLKREEVQKVKKLNPAKYVFVTSLPLSRDYKKEIKNIFFPYIKEENDVFGQEDINDFLCKYPEIEEKYFKLWISSTTVFNRIINNAIKGRSEFELERFQEKSSRYAQTEAHSKAIKILQENHVLIISGEPGIGKTTLAESMCLFFVAKGYEFFDIEESLSEAENVYARGRKQIFYFDDFLGSNYFEAIENKKDSHITKFIDRVRKDETKLFILTSRTNILNAGILYSSVLKNYNIQKNDFLLSIKSFSLFDRAKILYNHIWFSNLPENYIDEYYKNKRYKKVIKHQNFNPRIIEFITDIERFDVLSSDYWNYILGNLNNPKDIWDDYFKRQNNAYVRNLVKLTVLNGKAISEKELRLGFKKINGLENLTNPSHAEKDFNSISELATKSFLNRSKQSDKITYTLFNPSIADYILEEYGNNTDDLLNIFKSLNTIKSLEQLLSLEREKIIPVKEVAEFKNKLFDDAFQQKKTIDYLVFVAYIVRHEQRKKQTIIPFLKNISAKPLIVNEISKLLTLIIGFHKELGIEDFGFISDCIGDDRSFDETELEIFDEFIAFFEINNDDICERFQSEITSFLIDEIYKKIDIEDFISYSESNHFDEIDDEDNYKFNEEGAKEAIGASMEYMLEGYSSIESVSRTVYEAPDKEEGEAPSQYISSYDLEGVQNGIDIDIDEIIDSIDINEWVYETIVSNDAINSLDETAWKEDFFEQDIDDLFERS